MRHLEIIHLRLARACPAGLVNEIRRAAAAAGDAVALRIYRHAALASDISIHLLLQTSSDDTKPSDLGLRLADVFRERGMVKHSVWVEEEEANHESE